jgi:hypothetical protein
MPRWDDFFLTLNRIRFEASGVPQNFAEHAAGQVMAITQPEDWDRGWSAAGNYREAFSLAASQAARDADRERLERLGRTLQRMGQRMAEMPGEFFPRAMARNLQLSGCRALAKAWDDLDEREKARPFEDLARALDPKRHPPPTMPPDALDEYRGSGFVLRAYKGSRQPYSTPVTEAELRGGRLAEYALYERFIVHAGAAFLFLVAIIVSVAVWRDRRVLGSLPARLMGLLRPRDRALNLGLGLLLPAALYVLSTCSGWIAPRDKGLDGTRFILWLIQVVSLGIAAILLTLHSTRRCLARRGTMLAMEVRGPFPMLWMGILALGMIPVAAVMPRLMNSSGPGTMLCWITAGFMAGMPLLWLLNLAAYQFAGNPARRLHRALLLRAVVWPVALLMVMAAVAIPFLQQEERYWIGRLGYDAHTPTFDFFNTRTDQEYADWIRAEMKRELERLEMR